MECQYGNCFKISYKNQNVWLRIYNIYIASNTAVLGDSGVRKNCLGATIGTHVGPGVIGIAFFTK